MTEFLTVDDGTLAYEIDGSGPLVVLAHGMGDSRQAYRFLAPQLVAAGYQVASLDIRGFGESSTGWPSYTRTAIAGDIVALVRHLGAPAVLVGHSIAGGAVTIAAADAPELITAIVEIGSFTRKQTIRLSDFANKAYRQGATHLMGTTLLGSTTQWTRYLEVAYPGVKPADWNERLTATTAMLQQPGRMKALQKMGTISPADAGARLTAVQCPVLVLQGTHDPDWAAPKAEGEGIVAALPEGLGRLVMIDGAGHYPHVQQPTAVLAAMVPFLAEVAPAAGAARA